MLQSLGYQPVWCDGVKGSVESVPGNAFKTGLGFRNLSDVTTIRTFGPHLHIKGEQYSLNMVWCGMKLRMKIDMVNMVMIELALTESPMVRPRMIIRRGGPATSATNNLGKCNFKN